MLVRETSTSVRLKVVYHKRVVTQKLGKVKVIQTNTEQIKYMRIKYMLKFENVIHFLIFKADINYQS